MTTLHYNKKLVEKTTLKHYWTCVACLRIESNDDITLAQKISRKNNNFKASWECVACLRMTVEAEWAGFSLQAQNQRVQLPSPSCTVRTVLVDFAVCY